MYKQIINKFFYRISEDAKTKFESIVKIIAVKRNSNWIQVNKLTYSVYILDTY